MAYEESNGQVTNDVHHTRDPNALRVQYLKNSWTCYLETIAN